MCVGVGLVALLFRGLRFPLRWNQITFAYAAYYEPYVSALGSSAVEQSVRSALTHFIGLHPPLYSLVFTALYHASGAPGIYLVASGVFSSLAAVVCAVLGQKHFGKWVGLIAGILAAIGIYPLHYALEVNNYPLFFLTSALAQLSFTLLWVRPDRRSIWFYGLSTLLNLYTHALAALLIVVQAVALIVRYITLRVIDARLARAEKRLTPEGNPAPGWTSHRASLLARKSIEGLLWAGVGVTLLSLPLIGSVLELMGRGSTYHNEGPQGLALVKSLAEGLAGRFGSWPALLLFAGLVARGFWITLQNPVTRGAGLALGVQLLTLPFIVAMVRLGIAAGHQFPYYVLCIPSAVVLAAVGGTRLDGLHLRFRGVPRLALGGLVLAQLAFGAAELWDAVWTHRAYASRPHAMRAQQETEPPPAGALSPSMPEGGDSSVLWLIAPPLYEDDDKRSFDPVYLELSPWQSCRFYQPPDFPFEFVDYRFGQPFRCESLNRGTRILYTFTDVYTSTMPLILRHHLHNRQPVDIVLYDIEGAPSLLPRLQRVLEFTPGSCRQVGTTWLCRVEA